MTESQPTKTGIARSASVMAFATFLSRIMGLVREQAFAYFFGAGKWTDAFNVAFRIPNLLRDLFAEGAMSAAFVPTFNATLKKEGKERAFQLTSLTLSTLFVVVGLITLVGIYFSPEIVSVLAPEFKQTPEKWAVTVTMTRIMFPFLLAISWAAIVMGILNSLGEFFVPAIAPVFLNVAMIAAGFVISPLMPGFGYPPIVGMAIGAMLGGILQMAVQFPALWRQGFRMQPQWNPSDQGFRKICKLIIPGTIGLAATQVNIAISTILATSQGDGAVSWLGYAFRVMQLPLGIFGVAIAQATLPVISRQAADGDRHGMGRTLADSIKLTAFINIAATLALMALAEPVIRILFEHGRFHAADTVATSAALRAYASGLFFFSVIKVLSPAFYALNDTRIPVAASVTSVAVSIALNLLLINPCGYWGLALGSSLAAGVNAGILFFMLTRKLPGLDTRGILKSLIQGTGAALLMAVAMFLVNQKMTDWLKLTGVFSGKILVDTLSLCLSGLLGFMVLMISSRLFGMTEADQVWAQVKKRVSRFTGP